MSHDEDWREFRKCIRMAREIFATQPFDQFRGEELAPGSSVESDADIDKFVRFSAQFDKKTEKIQGKGRFSISSILYLQNGII